MTLDSPESRAGSPTSKTFAAPQSGSPDVDRLQVPPEEETHNTNRKNIIGKKKIQATHAQIVLLPVKTAWKIVVIGAENRPCRGKQRGELLERIPLPQAGEEKIPETRFQVRSEVRVARFYAKRNRRRKLPRGEGPMKRNTQK